MADVKKLESQLKTLTDGDASLREELEQTSTHYETEVAALQDQLQLLQQQLSSSTANQAAQGAAMQLLQRQLVLATADAADAAAAHQQAVLLLQQQLASATSASIVIPTAITAHSSATEGPSERETNSSSTAGGSTGSDSTQSGSATVCASRAHTSVSTGGKQLGDGKGPSSRTQLAAMRLELELSNAYAHALQVCVSVCVCVFGVFVPSLLFCSGLYRISARAVCSSGYSAFNRAGLAELHTRWD